MLVRLVITPPPARSSLISSSKKDHSYGTDSMARTLRSTSRIRKGQAPQVSYNKLSTVEQLVVYYYWIYLKTEGAEGWDNKKSGSTEHWRH